MFSNKMDFSSCVIWIDFHKCGHIYIYIYICVCVYVCISYNTGKSALSDIYAYAQCQG